MEKTIFKPKKRNYIYHKWSFATFKALKKLCRYEAEGSTGRSKQRRGQRDITSFVQWSVNFRYFCVASGDNNAIILWFSLICLESLGSFNRASVIEIQSFKDTQQIQLQIITLSALTNRGTSSATSDQVLLPDKSTFLTNI